MAIIRTVLMLSLLTGILLFIGWLFAGTNGLLIAFFFSLILNFATYWWSDKIALAMYRAKLSKNEKLNSIVGKLAEKAGLPKPRVYIIPKKVPNAFATGRNPEHSAVAVTEGLLNTLNEDEIEGVISHELGHIKNRDTLISTLAATIGGAISFLAQMAWWGTFSRDERGVGSIIFLPLIILAPLAATLVRLAISRGREYFADYTGAFISNKPLSLASALRKISKISKNYPIKGSPATAHMWIINPFESNGFTKLFMTHPPVEERVSKLESLADQSK